MKPLAALKQQVGAWLPKPVLAWIRRRSRVRWAGDYASWAEARRAAHGYDAPLILEKVVAATREVRDGRAAAERDSVLLPERPAGIFLETALELAATAGGNLTVLDFGGSLGSNYWPMRARLQRFPSARWAVVEQAHYVAAGLREFQNEQLRFYPSMDECCRVESPNLLLLSSVLPYLEDPHAFLAEAVQRAFPVIAIDRTGFVDGPTDRLTVQHVPPAIYPASYPCWFFNRARFMGHFADRYRLRSEHDNDDGEGSGFAFKGFLFQRSEG